MTAYTQLTDLAAAKSFALSGGDVTVPPGAIGVLLQAEDQNVRFRCDGTAPTAGVGMLISAGNDPIELLGQSVLQNLKVIETAASAKLNISFVVS